MLVLEWVCGNKWYIMRQAPLSTEAPASIIAEVSLNVTPKSYLIRSWRGKVKKKFPYTGQYRISLHITGRDNWWRRSMSSQWGKCLFHPFMFQHGAENIRVITAENRVGHLQRKGSMDRWTRKEEIFLHLLWSHYFYLERELFLAFTPMAWQDRATILCEPVLESPGRLQLHQTHTNCHCFIRYFYGGY